MPNAPTVTKDSIISKIKDTIYTVVPGTTTTICILTLENDFTVMGTSACVSSENFDREKGEEAAYDNAFDKIWVLEGYLLKQKLHEGIQTSTDARADKSHVQFMYDRLINVHFERSEVDYMRRFKGIINRMP